MANRLPPLNSLRAFEAVARHFSFTEAADELCVSTAAVSHQIRALEDHLGTMLFRRSNRSLSLTPAGAVLLPEIREAFVRLRNATAQLRRRELAGSLTIGVPPSFAAKWLIPRLPGLREHCPEIEVRVACTSELVDFGYDDVDVAIRYGRGKYPGLHSELLMTSEFFPVCSPALAGGHPGLLVPNDLRHFVLLHDETPAKLPTLPSWESWLNAAGARLVDPSCGPRFDASFLSLEMAIAGKGVALALSTLASRDLAEGRLVRPFARSLPSELSFFFVCPATALEQPKIKAFRAWLLEEAANCSSGLPEPVASNAERRRASLLLAD
jgi:LysR family transcriptional regulator, glycine cleavage system transcriptional activator